MARDEGGQHHGRAGSEPPPADQADPRVSTVGGSLPPGAHCHLPRGRMRGGVTPAPASRSAGDVSARPSAGRPSAQGGATLPAGRPPARPTHRPPLSQSVRPPAAAAAASTTAASQTIQTQPLASSSVRQTASPPLPPPSTPSTTTHPDEIVLAVSGDGDPDVGRGDALPDILHAHVPPPYPVMAAPSRRHRRRSYAAEDDGKRCCGCCPRCVACLTTFRWVLVSLALLGVACVITGIILAALHMTVGSSFLTLSLMFIGLGVMLVVVVGVGWRCTPAGHEPCHILFNLGEYAVPDRSRHHRSGRRHRERGQWLGGVVYPEFRYRRPPPSYTASMNDFHQQMILSELSAAGAGAGAGAASSAGLPNSPPPTYRSQASCAPRHGALPFSAGGYPASGPPTYRSHVSGVTGTSGASGASAPGSASSTLMRATQRVVSYLDSILGAQSDGESRAGRSPSLARASRDPSRDPSVQPSTSSGRTSSGRTDSGDDWKAGDEPRPADVCADTRL